MAALAVVLVLEATSSIVAIVGGSMTKLDIPVMIGGP
jgi:hypothetical protein